MGDRSAIEWTDATWNPTTGCDQVSPGCDHCYALTLAGRLKAMGSPAYQEDGDPRTSGPGFALQMHPDRLDQPLRWTKPRRIFVNSMSDLFHPRVTDEFIAEVFAVMSMVEDRHTFQVLTKRPKRMRVLMGHPMFRLMVNAARMQRGVSVLPDSRRADGSYAWPLRNVWLGTSVEDQQRADERIPPLLDTPAAVRFLSCEPLLGPVDLRLRFRVDRGDMTSDLRWERLHWVIVGGESGPGARPMHPDWVRQLRDQCTAAGVPFFFKQWGAWAPASGYDDGTHLVHVGGIGRSAAYVVEREKATTTSRYGHQGQYERREDLVDRGHPGWSRMRRVGKHAAGRQLDGRTWDEFPQAVIADA